MRGAGDQRGLPAGPGDPEPCRGPALSAQPWKAASTQKRHGSTGLRVQMAGVQILAVPLAGY